MNTRNILVAPLRYLRSKAHKGLSKMVIDAILSLTNADSQPNLSLLQTKIAKIDAMALNLKFFGYELARTLAEALPVRENLPPVPVVLKSSASKQIDLESEWVAYWCSELKIPVIFHRKIWELAYVLQACHTHGQITAGSRGLGFGCGVEPLPSYFASKNVHITVTDLAPEASANLGWVQTNQHTQSIDHAHLAHLVDRATFDANAELIYVDMNHIPDTLRDYDFCWSICALEHLGSIKHGLDFIENSIKTLKAGGLAVHTTEFNFANDAETIDNWPTVLFQKQHFREIATRLRDQGHHVAELDFNIGSKPLDRFIDIPPWLHDMDQYMQSNWGTEAPHLKICIDGFASTCFGLIITKRA